jgi:hypothetical protein
MLFANLATALGSVAPCTARDEIETIRDGIENLFPFKDAISMSDVDYDNEAG